MEEKRDVWKRGLSLGRPQVGLALLPHLLVRLDLNLLFKVRVVGRPDWRLGVLRNVLDARGPLERHVPHPRAGPHQHRTRCCWARCPERRAHHPATEPRGSPHPRPLRVRPQARCSQPNSRWTSEGPSSQAAQQRKRPPSRHFVPRDLRNHQSLNHPPLVQTSEEGLIRVAVRVAASRLAEQESVA
jgi:hypothetical protein